MALVISNAGYHPLREVKLGSILPGHTVLINDQNNGKPGSYVICKIGNTKIEITSTDRKCILLNNLTGRLVLKHADQKCVVVSSSITLTDFNGEYHVRRAN